MFRPVVPFRVLSRTNLAYFPHPSSLNSRPVNLLQPLCRLQKSQLLYYQANPASFCKIPAWGVPPYTSPLQSPTSSRFSLTQLHLLQLMIPNPSSAPHPIPRVPHDASISSRRPQP